MARSDDRLSAEHATAAAPAVAPSSGGLPAVGAIAAGPAPAGSIATPSLAALGEPEAEAEEADGASAGAMAVQSSGGGAPQLRFYALDALGSVRVVFDGHGNVIGRADYEPFGAPVVSSTTGTLPRQRFTGQERDGEVGADYFGARTYLPVHGRMLSVDPLYAGAVADPQRWNRYAYALNSPTGTIDPDGRTGCTTTVRDGGFTVGCPNGGSGGPAVNTPSPSASPLLGNFNPSTDDYYSWMYYPGWSYGPGQTVSHPKTPPVTDVGEQISDGDSHGGANIGGALPPQSPPPEALPMVIQRFAPLLARIQNQAAMLMAKLLGSVASRPSVINYADKVWKTDRNHSLPTFFDQSIVRMGWVDRVSQTYSVFRMPATLTKVDGVIEIGGNISGGVMTVTHRVFIPMHKYKGPTPWTK